MDGLNDSGIGDGDEECLVMLGVFVRICVEMILRSKFTLKLTWLAQMTEHTTFNCVAVDSIPTLGAQKVQISIPEECVQKSVPILTIVFLWMILI